jgi:hypothetical protein
MREIFAGMPWWVKWVAVPVIALVVFGGLIATVVGFVIGCSSRRWSSSPWSAD